MTAVRMAAFVRAINTTGRRLTNQQLVEPFHTMGLSDVAAYQAAGNVVFRSDREPDDLQHDLSHALGLAYGFDAPTFVRTFDQLRECVEHRPFDAETLAVTEGRTQISFLAETPIADRIAEAVALVPGEDTVAFVGREFYWLPRAGVSDSRLPVTRIERIIGPMTMRTLGTVDRMVHRFAD